MWFIIVYYIVVVISFFLFANPVVKLQEEFQYLKLGKKKEKKKKKKKEFSLVKLQVSVLSTFL
jgi:hypothetical protein